MQILAAIDDYVAEEMQGLKHLCTDSEGTVSGLNCPIRDSSSGFSSTFTPISHFTFCSSSGYPADRKQFRLKWVPLC